MGSQRPATDRRLLGIGHGLLPLVAGFAALQLALWFVLGPAPRAIAQAELVDPDARFDIAMRAEQAMTLVRSGAVSRDELVVVAGLSTAREGIDPSTFEAASSGRVRLLNLAYSGGSFEEMLAYYGPVLPMLAGVNHVVLAIHPAWLAGRPLRAAPAPLGPALTDAASASPRKALGVAYTWATEATWATGNRLGMHYLLRAQALAWRQRLGAWFGIAPGALRPAGAAGPWAVVNVYTEARASQEALDAQVRFWQFSGWFDARNHTGDSAQAAALAELVSKARAAARHTTVVLMPEDQALRGRVPASAKAALAEVVRQAAPDVAVIDLGASMSDSAFYDHAHLNADGRRAFSARLARRFASDEATP